MPNDGQIPGANVFVATVYRLSRSPNSLLALVNFVNETFAIFLADHDVIPKGQQCHIQPSSRKPLMKIFDLSAFSRAIQPGETDQQGPFDYHCTSFLSG